MENAWKVIINPNAGSGRGASDWPEIRSLMEREGIEYSEVFTSGKGDAISLVVKAVEEGYRRFVSIGGDGTLHEVVNGIMTQSLVESSQLVVSAIPVGTGNDWGRLYNLSTAYEDCVRRLKRCNTVLQDAGKMTSVSEGVPKVRYMVNIGGLGFDASVCHQYDRLKSKGKKGKIQYMKGLLRGFLWYKPRWQEIRIDGKPFFSGDVFSVAFGVGRFSGGGMLQTPDAKPDDGLMDVTVIEKVSKLKILVSLGKLYNGNIYNIKEVSHGRGRVMEIVSKPESPVEVDGEVVGETSARLEMIDAALRVVVD